MNQKTHLYEVTISREVLPLNGGKETVNVWYNVVDETGKLLHKNQLLDFCETLKEAEASIDKFESGLFDYQGIKWVEYSPKVTQTEIPRVCKARGVVGSEV